jgi:hypothetical protein
VFRSREISLHLSQRYFLQAALGVRAAFGVAQRAPADVGGKDFDLPRLCEFQSFRNRDGDRIRLFARRTARAPDAQRARILPKLSLLNFRQDFLIERFVNRRIAKG